jgi:hypothetical protein
MNVTSFSVTDVGFHYIALRVLAGLPKARRDQQVETVSRNVLKYVRDNALRLLLPEPHGNFEAVGDKVCRELVHFQFARLIRGQGYELTAEGERVLDLLNAKKFSELRREMVLVHLRTYDNLRLIVDRHIHLGSILSPVVEVGRIGDHAYIAGLLKPTFHERAAIETKIVLNEINEVPTAKKIENALRSRILTFLFGDSSVSLPIFRSTSDRLISLRLLNVMKTSIDGCDFAKSYSPCFTTQPAGNWYTRMIVPLASGDSYTIFLSEPNSSDDAMQQRLLDCLDDAFSQLTAQAGYYDLPDVRDFVCEHLKIPEGAFDEGINTLLDQKNPPVTVGLTYERISGRRKPMMRSRGTTQVFNLIRKG